jgi:hypothetical protein
MLKRIKDKIFPNRWRNYLIGEYVAGHWFYYYKNVQYLHNKRQALFQVAVKESEYGITYSDLLACTSLTKKALNAGDIGMAHTYLNALETYTGLVFNHSTLFKICDAVILMDGEPEHVETEEWTLKKRQAFENSDEVKGFFFGCAQRTLSDFSRFKNDISIGDYMRQQEVKTIESLFLNLITEKK